MDRFEQGLDRRGHSLKWDAPLYPAAQDKPLIPMWIADMDFPVPDCVLDAVRKRLSHPTLGYEPPAPAFAQAVVQWEQDRRGNGDIRPEFVQYQNSVVGALVAAVQTLTQPGDPVLVQTPNYTGFTYGLEDAGRKLIPSPLVQDGAGVFRMDLADMEQKIRAHNISCLIFCSPHNPTGRVWQQDELTALAKLCEAYGVAIISDEVWADFVYAPSKHIPTALISPYAKQNTITTYGATKTFNIASLHAAYSVVYARSLRERYSRQCGLGHYNVPNPLSEAALIGGFTQGASYVDELLSYIRANMEFAYGFLRSKLPQIGVYLPEGTYNLWLDFTRTGRSDAENMALMGGQGLVLSPASEYNGTGWFRMNVACPRTQLEQALLGLELAMRAEQ